MAEELTDADRKAAVLWTSHQMTFHAGRGKFITIPRFTECRKIPYTKRMRGELTTFDKRGGSYAVDPGDFWAYVEIANKVRLVRRSDVLSRRQYDAIRDRERSALGALFQKSHGSVGEGVPEHGRDPAAVATEDGGSGEPRSDA